MFLRKICFWLACLFTLPVLLAACGETATSTVAPTTVTATTAVPTTSAPTTAVATTSGAMTTVANTVAAPTPAATTAATGISADKTTIVTIKEFASTNLGNNRRIDIFLPPAYNPTGRDCYRVLYMNDGQDVYTYNLDKVLDGLYAKQEMEPIIVVALYNTPSRLSEYGVAGVPDYKGRGDKAALYSKFVLEEVMPYMKKNYCVKEGAQNTAFMGSSLGGLAAFDLVWRNPDKFGKVGVFSGSFWWRTDDANAGAQQISRIMHKVVRESPKKPGLKFWFEAGTQDETSDRDGNGMIDAIQDTIELIEELTKKGYKPEDITYIQVEGGKHDQLTWLRVLPNFLKWAFPPVI
jgi:enterochelin esterase-like enzyme